MNGKFYISLCFILLIWTTDTHGFYKLMKSRPGRSNFDCLSCFLWPTDSLPFPFVHFKLQMNRKWWWRFPKLFRILPNQS